MQEILGSTKYSSMYLEDIHVSEKNKNSKEYLKANIDYWIANLVRDKSFIKTYRNYYSGVRDEEEFKYLTENFGIGTPSKLNFTPLIKPRIDAILGKIEEETVSYRVTCIDDKTIDTIAEGKKNKKLTEIEAALGAFVQANLTAVENGQGEAAVTAVELVDSVGGISARFKNNYLSEFEIAAQDLLKYFSNSYHIDLKQKLKQMSLDMLITGECYYRVYCDRIGSDPILEVIKPENIFYNKNTNSQYIDTSDAIVHREFLTRKEVLKRYGKFMSKKQLEYLFGDKSRIQNGATLHRGSELDYLYSESVDHNQMSYRIENTVTVDHVEWLATNSVDLTPYEKSLEQTVDKGYQSEVTAKGQRYDRYEGTLIGGGIYVNCGKSSYIARSQVRPYDCGFTYGGTLYNDRGGKAYSMVGAMKDLQDVYDLTMFHRDNLIANSGVPGDRINLAGIPTELGDDFMERLMKFTAMKKNGFELIDPTQPGAQLFQHYGGFDNSVNGNSLTAINAVLESMERQADLITGVNQQMLGQIAQRDAVSNVATGIRQSMLINEDLLELNRNTVKRLLTEMLDISKVCYREGKKGSYIMGSEAYIFEVFPENFVFSDHAIEITYSSKDEGKVQDVKMLAKELVGAGMLDPDTLVHLVMSDSTTEMKRIVNNGWARKKKENDVAGQAKQQAEQLQQQLQQAQAELQRLTQQVEAAQGMKDQLEKQRFELEKTVAEDKGDLERDKLSELTKFNNATIDVKRELTQLEREQLYLDSSGNSAEIKNQ